MTKNPLSWSYPLISIINSEITVSSVGTDKDGVKSSHEIYHRDKDIKTFIRKEYVRPAKTH